MLKKLLVGASAMGTSTTTGDGGMTQEEEVRLNT